ncbi:N-acetylmuramoyl-L-alanine amidase [bacterium]|nr:N-acetylmuramoyl-L-alanine amidase [bacterium]
MKRILIDPGHGGSDPGAVANGVKEKDLAWQYSLTLKYLLQQKGYDVGLTRWGDAFVPLGWRGQLAKGYDVFCSVHFNAGSEKAKGTEVWYHDKKTRGKQLASLVERELKKVCSSRSIKKDTNRYRTGFCVLRVAEGKGVPAILVEVDFITNPEMAKLLQTREERIKRMQAVADGIDKFLKGG